ncbi:MAG: rhomboid family intramembrane serine protease [Lachnospiraceae bacterium]|nr:rhomboid family intramembrane serine protease [Lachnospiraceae bacterium]
MTSEQVERLFYENGYMKTPSNLPEFTFYWRKENQGITVIFVIDYRQEIYISVDQYAHMKEKIIEFFHAKGEREIHMLSLILSSDTEKAKKLCVNDSFCWMVDMNVGRLLIFENQVDDFYGFRKILENLMTQMSFATDDEGLSSKEERLSGRDVRSAEKWSRERIAGLPWVNICLVAVNVFVFLICTFTGELLYNKGAFGVQEIMVDRSYYRMITSMFLHSDVDHLVSNMIVLYYVGEIVERKVGHIPYVIIYFLSGTAGNIFSMGYELWSGDYYSSIGASGAVFGAEGALLLLIILHHGKMEHVTVSRLAFAIAFSLYCGFTGSYVNNAAHIGGVLMGFAATAVIVMLCARVRMGKDRDINEN